MSIAVLGDHFPPSTALFSDQAQETLIPVLKHLQSTDSPIFIGVYPYYYYAGGQISQEFATFSAHKAVYRDKQLGYWNMYDALVDAFLWAMEKRDLDVKIIIGETGWPSAGNGNYTTPELARTYNQNFLRDIAPGYGTPKRPETYWDGFVYSLFDENGKSEAEHQRFGISKANGQPVYHLYFPYP